MTGPQLLPTWSQLGVRPQITDPMRRYLEQIGAVLRPGSVGGADLALRSFAGFLLEVAPEVTSIGQVTRRHVEDYKPWLANRPGQNRTRLTPATIAHRLGTLRMFFVRLDEWGWDEAPERVPMFPGDLPRQDHPLPKGLDEVLAGARRRAGLAHATCHELRHTCLTRLREAGMALEAVQAQAGHASIESTRIYLHLADDWLAAQYRKAAEVLDAQVFAGHPTAPPTSRVGA